MEATPLPWQRDGHFVYALTQDGWRKGQPVMTNRMCFSVQAGKGAEPGEAEATAEFIERACNAHDALVSALKAVIARYGPDATYLESEVWNQARAALAKAEERG